MESFLNSSRVGWQRVSYHVVFWVFFLAFYTFLFGYPDRYWYILKGNIVSLPFDMLAVYFTIYFLLPKYLIRRKYWKFIIGLVLSATAIILLERAYSIYIVYAEANKETPFFDLILISWFIYVYFIVFFALLIKLSKSWYINYRKTKKLEKEKLEAELRLKEAELNLLKAQNHPHFLFNTLNNLYGLTLEKSDHAPEVVLKLSGLLDYMLYECNEPVVKLSKEIDHIRNYIALEKLRYDDSLKLEFKIEGEIKDQRVAPLLMLPFIENSFKHGVSKELNNPWINIKLIIQTQELIFSIKNSKALFTDLEVQSYTEGIGLKNVKKRIELAHKENYSLEIEDGEEIFSVLLKLKLDNNK